MNPRRAPELALVLVVAVGALLLVLVSAAGTSAVDFGKGWTPGYKTLPTGSPPPAADNAGDVPTLITVIAGLGLGMIILVGVLLFVFGMIILIGALRLQVRLRMRRRRVGQLGEEQEAENEPSTMVRGLIRRAVRDALDELLRRPAGGEPGDAVVAAWLVLETAAAEAGSARKAHQTPTEFTTAVLAGHAVDRDALDRLRRLYQRARFGTTSRVTEDDVAAAEADLRRLVGDLAGSRR